MESVEETRELSQKIRELSQKRSELMREWEEIYYRTDLSPEEKEKRKNEIRSQYTELSDQVKALTQQARDLSAKSHKVRRMQQKATLKRAVAWFFTAIAAIGTKCWLTIPGVVTLVKTIGVKAVGILLILLKLIWLVIGPIAITLWAVIKTAGNLFKALGSYFVGKATKPVSLKTVGIWLMILLLFFIGGSGFWATMEIKNLRIQLANAQNEIKNLQAQLKKVKPVTPVKKVAPLPKPKVVVSKPKKEIAPVKKVKITKEKEKVAMAVIKKGEGIEHAFIRQLINSPNEFGYNGSNNKKAVKKWAQTMAHQLAILAGYVSKDGKEIRIRNANIAAYVIQVENEKITIEEYMVKNGIPKLIHSQKVANNYSTAKFKSKLQPYEYLWP